MDAEKRIREAARELSDAIAEGREQNLRVEWPGSVDGMASLAVSEIGPAVERVAVTAQPDGSVVEKPVSADV